MADSAEVDGEEIALKPVAHHNRFNPLNHPITFTCPSRISVSAWIGHVPFAMYLVDVLRPKAFAELGTHYGVSYCAFCEAVKELGLETRCYAIDSWQGDAQAGFYGPEVLADLEEHHNPLYGAFSRLIQSTFDEALEYFPDHTFDLLHIDGFHTYEAVKQDFQKWLPKLSDRGVVLFHDINVREREFGVWKLWEELKLEFPHFEFVHSHGLGVLAVGKAYPDELNDLVQCSPEEATRIRSFFAYLGARLEVIQELKALKYKANEQSGALIHLQEQARRNEEEIASQRTAYEAQLARQSEELSGARSGHEAQIRKQTDEFSQARSLFESRLASQAKELSKTRSLLSASQKEGRQASESSESLKTRLDENQNIVRARDQEIVSLRKELATSREEKSSLMALLFSKTREIDEITGSRQWRLLSRYGRLTRRVLSPVNRMLGGSASGDNRADQLPSTHLNQPPISELLASQLSMKARYLDQVTQSGEEAEALRRRIRRRTSAALTANPNPVHVFDGSGEGATTLSYTFLEGDPVEVRIGAPDGPLFTRPDSSGEKATGKWVTDGAVFFLQDVSDGNSLTIDHTLATVTVRVTAQEALESFEPAFDIPREPLPGPSASVSDVKAIAFYLPQFHTIPENDEWWGPGFTEWTNVRRGKPQFKDHHQPHVPSDLDYYDLRDATVFERQVELAQANGIYGFCFYYYWFEGRLLLDLPVRRMLERGKPDFPFCICWANENWTRRWDGQDNEVLIGQQHSPKDDLAFLNNIESILVHKNYIRIEDKPLLIVYHPALLPDAEATAERWREAFRKRGHGEIFLAAVQTFADRTPPQKHGFDAVIQFPPHARCPVITGLVQGLDKAFSGYVYDYNQTKRSFIDELHELSSSRRIYPGVMPSWDNTARCGNKSSIWINSSPESYYDWLSQITSFLRSTRPRNDRLVFINAWNEWAEGCHLEPDQLFGYSWLNATRLALQEEAAQVETAGRGPDANAFQVPLELKAPVRSTLNSSASSYESVTPQVSNMIPGLKSHKPLSVRSVSNDAHPAGTQKLLSTSWLKENAALFDAEWYLLQNPDVARSGGDPVEHYVRVGAREGRAPHPLFDPRFYLKTYPQAALSGLTPLEHYLTKGWQKGYKPNPKFDPSFYLSTYSDIAAAGIEPLTHFVTNGLREGRVVCKEDVCLEPFEAAFEIPREPMAWKSPLESAVKAIAFFLPQFHPIPENDRWWGAGFTEWTNVRKGEPQFREHYQPHVPSALGYYDLREPEMLERQAQLARDFGIYGFCFYYYWFAGKVLLDLPIRRMLDTGKPDFPFCICWANENWTRRWDGSEGDLLIGQHHSPDDDLAFLRNVEDVLLHRNYIRVDDKPMLIVYQPSFLPDPSATAGRWRDYFRAQGHGELFLVSTQTFDFTQSPDEYGFDAVIQFPPHCNTSAVNSLVEDVDKSFTGQIYDYNRAKLDFVDALRELSLSRKIYPGVMPSWDNTARRRNKSSIWINSSPESYHDWLLQAVNFLLRNRPHEEKFVFINAWNEWAEGCHLEPDQLFGYAWLNATRLALESEAPQTETSG